MYILGAFYVTLHLWIDPARRLQHGDAADVDQATWFVRYSANAVDHFHLPALITTTMNYPHGVNMMWNTSFLLPGVLVSPITILGGPQTALTALLVIGFAGSAASMFYVLRHWRLSILAAALGGALYGFSPALINSGIGHYSLVLAMLPPLIIDRVLRLVTRDGSPVRNGIWLGLFVAGQVFIAEETLVDTVIAVVIFLVVLAISRPRSIRAAIPPALIGLGTGAVVALILCARGLWVQFHGIAAHGAAATVTILYNGHYTNLGTIPYVFVMPGDFVVLHTSGTAPIVLHYTQPAPEYLAYLGIPLIIVLLVAIVYFWKNVAIRAAGTYLHPARVARHGLQAHIVSLQAHTMCSAVSTYAAGLPAAVAFLRAPARDRGHGARPVVHTRRRRRCLRARLRARSGPLGRQAVRELAERRQDRRRHSGRRAAAAGP